MGDDPWEMRNRWFDPDCTAIRRELEADLLEWQVTTTRPKTQLGLSRPRRGDPEQSAQRYDCRGHGDHKLDLRDILVHGKADYA